MIIEKNQWFRRTQRLYSTIFVLFAHIIIITCIPFAKCGFAWVPNPLMVNQQHRSQQHHHPQQHSTVSSFVFTSAPQSSVVQVSATTTTAISEQHSSKYLLPRLSIEHLKELKEKNYVIIPNFISESFVNELRRDVFSLRNNDKFNVAKVGQDSTNQLDTTIRTAEQCFIGRNKLRDVPPSSMGRNNLYNVLETIQDDIMVSTKQQLDHTLSEFLYVYYSHGGYYRRHCDAIPGSASTLRQYSLLLYLNQMDWNNDDDGGKLRMYFDDGDSSADSNNNGAEPIIGNLEQNCHTKYIDVDPTCGTLVLFKSDTIPHEVLDTNRERIVVVGWYNRPVLITDIQQLLPSGMSPIRIMLLAISGILVTIGITSL